VVFPCDAMGPTREASGRAVASLRYAIARANNANTVSCFGLVSVTSSGRSVMRVTQTCERSSSSLGAFGVLSGYQNHRGARSWSSNAWLSPDAHLSSGCGLVGGSPPGVNRTFQSSSTGGAGSSSNGGVGDKNDEAGKDDGATKKVQELNIPTTDPGAAAVVQAMSVAQKAAMLKALLAEKPRLTQTGTYWAFHKSQHCSARLSRVITHACYERLTLFFPKTDTKSLFTEADLDGDKTLTMEEFDRVLLRFGKRGYTTVGGASGLPNDGLALTSLQTKALFLSQFFPFVGFGFMDNAIMIIAGEYIEMGLGSALALSTMAAAGLGNLLSDIAGIGFSKKIETLTETWLKIRPPELSRAQAGLFNTKAWKIAGAVIGVSIGCVLGMFPLLFFDADADHGLRDEKKKPGKKK
jgi:hypothetical protein